jgi:hypothetical protein
MSEGKLQLVRGPGSGRVLASPENWVDCPLLVLPAVLPAHGREKHISSSKRGMCGKCLVHVLCLAQNMFTVFPRCGALH